MNLKHISDKSILSHTLLLVHKEREILSEILWHLKEIDRRKLYSDLRCSSLFDYCVKVLKYSEGQASRRVSATRLLKEVPLIIKQIENGEINLTQLNQAKQFFDEMAIRAPSEKQEVINKISGKTTRESEKILWELRGEDVPRKVILSLKEDTVKRLKHVQSMNSHKCHDMDSLLLEMCKEIEKHWDPEIVKRRSRGAQIDKRYISTGLKADIWKRDQGKCHICKSTNRLEVDHIKPFAMGGKTEIENLRLLCRNCNQRAGIKFFGNFENTSMPKH